jgi:hypothetical protein
MLVLGVFSPICNAFYQINPDGIVFDTPRLEQESEQVMALTGTIQNVSGKELYSVIIKVSFFNNKDEQVGDSVTIIDNITVDGSAKYKVSSVVLDKTTTARITSCKVYAK